ncbi:MAG: FliM/FliN family flagellar motor C-terminal domain-containing protein, partial [Actinomycetota bacterium]|nr:FliM/FliN family flagellar motor C-terminal domain-containing protein [Actinomycetota bacterium]
VELRLRFAPVSIPSRDLLALEPGVVLALGHPVQDPLELAIGDVVVGSAELGATGRRCVARITRMEKKE